MPYIIQGKPATLSTEPFLHGDKHFVSLDEILEQVGGSATFDNDAKVATAVIEPWTAEIKMDDFNVSMSSAGKVVPVTLTAAPYVENDEMFVPYDFIRDAFGYKVEFDDDTETVSITNPNLPVG